MSELKVSYGANTSVRAKLDEFPFRVEFSLAPLISYWEREIADGHSVLGEIAESVLERVRRAPELTAQVFDPAALGPHLDLLRALMAAVISPASHEDGHAAALLPFRLQTFYATPAFTRDLTGAYGVLKGRVNVDPSLLADVRIMHTYSVILRRVYGLEVGVDGLIIPAVTLASSSATTDLVEGLERFAERRMS